MDSRTRAIIIGAGAIIALTVFVLLSIFLSKAFKLSGQSVQPGRISVPPLPTLVLSPTPTVSGQSGSNLPSNNQKTYTGQGFIISYPDSWGLLTCSNSQNIEFDPENLTDVKNIICDSAVKPVTILVSAQRFSCRGELATLGNYQVVRSKNILGNDINYEWCFSAANMNFDITERVSPTGSRATSKKDFSIQVEELIKSIRLTSRAS